MTIRILIGKFFMFNNYGLAMKGAVLLVILSISGLSYGHGGGLAADGCHNEKSTGTRHCHKSKSSSTPTYSPAPVTKPSSSSGGGCGSYDREEWGYKGFKFSTDIGFYSGQSCSSIDSDHLVSLKDAHESGGCYWGGSQKVQFANDVDNLVPSCARINRSKGASLPHRFIRLAGDGKGVDFQFTGSRKCAYLSRYAAVKKKYQLSFRANNLFAFSSCGISF
ncbi:MAG: hypothetical protein HAW61_02525 [Candidatus Portiera sp.]|nr:hypothetical protein [Portiera sp.]